MNLGQPGVNRIVLVLRTEVKTQSQLGTGPAGQCDKMEREEMGVDLQDELMASGVI